MPPGRRAVRSLQSTLSSKYVASKTEGSSSFARLQRMKGRVALCHRWRNITLQHQPQNAVIELIVHAIGCAEIQTLRQACGCSILRILFIQVLGGVIGS